MNKQTTHRVHMEKFKKLNEVEGKEQCHVETSRFTALENLDTEVNINRAWEIIRDNFTTLPLYPRRKSLRYPLHRRFDKPQSQSGRCGEERIHYPTEIRTTILRFFGP
jgi:hypothetical protein